MKLAEWDTTFGNDLAFITSRLSALKTSEVVSLCGKDDQARERALMVTDVGLLDCHEAWPGSNDTEPDLAGWRGHFEVRLIPWTDVPIPWIVFVGFVNSSGNLEPGREAARVTMELDPRFTHSYDDAKQVKAATVFFNAVVERRR